MVNKTTERAKKIRRALTNALQDSSVSSVRELANYIDWYLKVSEKASKK